VQHRGKARGETVIGKSKGDVALDFFGREEFEREIRTQAFGLQGEPHREEGVLRDDHVGSPVGCDDENPHGSKLICSVIQQIDG
jgi:hypothetical protein